MGSRAHEVGERFEFNNGYKYGNLNVASTSKICFSGGYIDNENKPLFPKEAIDIEAFLTIDAGDCSDGDISIYIDLCPMDDNGGPMKKHQRRFDLGDYSRDEVKELFTKAVACL